MLRLSCCFLLGVLAFHQLARLPGWWWLGAELLLIISIWRRFALRPVLALIIGFTWSHAFALVTVPPTLPGEGEVRRVLATGRVVSLPGRSLDPARFIFEADTIEGLGEPLSGAWRFRLSWRDPPAFSPGQRWRLPLRLRAAHGYATPGAWDYEGWLYWQGIRYTGYVSRDDEPRLLPDAPCCWLARVRGAASAAVDAVPASDFTRGVVRAITVGDQSGLTEEAKALFRATGTSHLMAISGLHIGLLAGLGLFLFAAVWRRIPALCARVPARLAGAGVGLLLAAAYAALAGMGLPTQRALIMLGIFALGLLLRRESSTLHALATAAVCVLLWHPPSIVSAGFWLSFVAVLAILAALQWGRGEAVWRQAIRVQLAIGLALWPILTVFGMPASGVAPPVNLLLVPVFGLIVVPVSLLGVALLFPAPAAGALIIEMLGHLLDWIKQGLLLVSNLPMTAAGAGAPGVLEFVALLVAVGLVLAPPGIPLRWLALPLFALAWLPRAHQLDTGEFDIHLLDVGQGLSTVVETRHHTLVFDTGPEFPTGFSTAEAVVVPFLGTRGRKQIDLLVLSHGDKDHAGGIGDLLADLDVKKVQSGEPQRIGFGAQPCVAGERWQWDGVDFEFLHPSADAQLSGNNASCVLRVTNMAGAVLFTGDIERGVERQLSRSLADKLHSHIVVAPHHGSRSSSSAEFVAATRPARVLYSAGWANRYGFPAPAVAERWRDAGARGLNTTVAGTINFRFGADGVISGPGTYRQDARRFWWHDGGSAEPLHAVSSAD